MCSCRHAGARWALQNPRCSSRGVCAGRGCGRCVGALPEERRWTYAGSRQAGKVSPRLIDCLPYWHLLRKSETMRGILNHPKQGCHPPRSYCRNLQRKLSKLTISCSKSIAKMQRMCGTFSKDDTLCLKSILSMCYCQGSHVLARTITACHTGGSAAARRSAEPGRTVQQPHCA